MFNTFGAVAAITTPIVIGYIVGDSGSFDWALMFVGACALLAVFSYVFIVGPIKRLTLEEMEAKDAERKAKAGN